MLGRDLAWRKGGGVVVSALTSLRATGIPAVVLDGDAMTAMLGP